MLTWKERALAAAGWIWEAWGDPKNKNRAAFLLLLMVLFGMVSPERATELRDTVLALMF